MGAIVAAEHVASRAPPSRAQAPEPGRGVVLRRWAREVAVVEWIAVAAALAPLVVAVVRAGATGWMPVFDAGYFTVRSRDVLTSHHPFVGAWSMGSHSVGVSVNNLGPLQLDLLAPFTKLWPYWGAALGTATINAAAVIGVSLVGRRLFGVPGVIGAMIATVCLEVSMGSWNLIESRQQLALLIPFWCLLWLSAALAAGHVGALPWAVFVASLIVQTHLTFVLQTVSVMVVGVAGLVVAVADGRSGHRTGRVLLVTCGVALLCWAQTFWDQFFGTGNLGTALGQSDGAESSVGLADGVRYIAAATLAPPFWLPGHMGEFLRPRMPTPSSGTAWIAFGAWLTAMVATVAIGWWARRRAVIALGAVGGSALVGAAGMAAMIPPTRQFGVVPYNYYWMWPISIFATTAAVAAGLSASRHLVGVTSEKARRSLLAVAAVACVVLAAVAGRPVNGLPETADEPTAGDRVGRELLGELGTSLDRLDIEGPVVIDLDRESFANHFPYTMLVELQRRGILFTFPPRDINRARFGGDRCEDGTSPHRLVLADGAASLTPGPGERVLAQVDAVTAAEKSEHAALSSEFADLLREGTVPLSFGALSYFGIEPDPRLTQVFQNPDASAAGLGGILRSLRALSIVKIPNDLASTFDRWLQLENLLIYDRVAIFLAPNHAHYDDDCDSVRPGDVIITG